ncbi:S-adenosylmethionine:tRNAribosyltransferase-isom erase [Emticicia oligotrophica DSM 17448]|uniref:S-adenosylmethionine:tRNA ribosyltransferase-isomerase n=1 Tax=Emticicia oligotrophica (strain DSM 17448 / CIP 109782 / MTCC 6937 / GPTSA100-15) TaxID=929562 RepID=A0ABM5MZ53_EMTOG|nr:S-adenosylmethionine:tRNA ribosyltransferase-isomerase [Emticicia oligotrophica]AFK02467.1 S-adenosylmethionine:tRNAribosyltransferase-isom erase [Emticicia oligotrophica DSM 17448]
MLELDLEKYNYDLPDERIARFPVEPRDSSKLLLYKSEQISEDIFHSLPKHLPDDTFLVFNNTKVIPARLFFQKANGVVIEVFLLNPVEPSNVVSQVMETTDTCTWACMIGNKKRFKEKVSSIITGAALEKPMLQVNFIAELVDVEKNYVKFSWDNRELSFAEIVRYFGQIPLPPYLKRETEQKDYDTYQTVYSKKDGAVAAPTAGLHFTENVFTELEQKGIKHDFVTLHVGAGTFQPIKVKNVVEHNMHCEQIVFEKSFIENLLANASFVIPVGTTSMRSLESLYWYGVKLCNGNEAFFIEKLLPYEQTEEVSLVDSLQAILAYMNENNLTQIIGETEIFIFPSYKFRVCKGIITNFHQPDSTLILLVAALVGENWQKIYNYALENDFRFLSYGDSSLLIP